MKIRAKKYLGFCVVNYIAYDFLNKTIHNKIEKDGYEYVNKTKSVGNEIVHYSTETLLLATPIINLLATTGCATTLLNKKVYEEYKRNLLERKHIVENIDKPKVKTK